MSTINALKEQVALFDKCQNQVLTIFGVNLEDYWGLSGFDIIKFGDKVVMTPNNFSIAEQVAKKWGLPGVNLILQMIKAEPVNNLEEYLEAHKND
jgi:hypothetical protein